MSQSIVFVDSALPDYQSLLAAIPGTDNQVVLIDSSRDGISQMLDALAGRSGIDAIHILGHGASGSVQLGTTTLTSANLNQNQSQLAELGGHLTPTGDLLLYGCNVAQGADGVAFIEQIAQMTGADVAASTDLTGAATLGGDWVLEAQTGSIEAQAIFSNANVLLVAEPITQTFTQSGQTGTVVLDGPVGGANFGAPGNPNDTWIKFANITSSNSAIELVVKTGGVWTTVSGPTQWNGGSPTDYMAGAGTGVDYGVRVNFDALGVGEYTLSFSETGSSGGNDLDYFLTFRIGTQGSAYEPPAPANTAPVASNGTLYVNEGSSNSINLSTLVTDAQTASSALTYSGAGVSGTSMSYSAGTNPGSKGTYNVANQSYTVSDSGPGSPLSANALVNIYVTYADDPTTWGSGPTNQNWITSGTNSYQLSGAYDPDDNVNYSIVSGAPSWIHINGSGQIYGNVAPEFAGQTYNLTARASGSTSVDRTFSITTGTAAQLNDLPTANTGSQTVAEDAPAHLTFAAGNFNFTDLDNSVGLSSSANGAALASIRIDSLTSHGTLTLNDVAVTSSQVILAADIANLKFTPTTDYSGSDSYTYSVNDGIAWSASPTTMNITITPSNDAPVLVDGQPTMITITEDETSNVGNLVSDLISRTGGGAVSGDKSGMTDVDTLNNGGLGNAPESVGLGIAIHSTTINGPSTGGAWQYKLASGGGWINFGSVSDSAALLLKSTDSVRFLPDGKNGQTASFDYYAWDQFSGSAGSTANATSRGGSTAFSLDGDSTTITITDVNDAPTIVKPVAQTVAEDATVSITGISFSDVDIVDRNDGVANNNDLNATLSVLHGTITLAGTTGITVDEGADASGTMTITGSLSAINTAIATLIYAPGRDYSGADTLSLSVNDIGNVGSGGVKTTTDTLAITVTPTNDAPVLVDGRPTLTTITENDTANSGNLVSDLISRTGGGANPGDKTGITDVDTLNNGGNGNAPESVGQGIAIFSAVNNNRVTIDDGATFNDYGTGGGHWEYSINNGTSWTAVDAVHAVDSTHALLLSSTDKVRFIPDTANGTMGTLNYYLWDGANGTTHTTQVDVTTRGDATPYSVRSDIATLVVSNVNDAPVLDLDGNNSSGASGNSVGGGASFTKEFLVRGTAVAIADTDMTITDVDTTGGVTGPIVYDTVASATVAITATALPDSGSVVGGIDNLFGYIYETFTAASASVTGSLGTITVNGSGTESITISGAGTWQEYQDIIKAITYQNANPNAFPGARTVTVSITDSATAGGTSTPVSATSTITNVWAPSVDTNGVADGVNYTTSYTEGSPAVNIASADATITDQDSHLRQVVVSISNVLNAGSETLTIAGGNGSNWNGITGLTVSGSGTSTLTLSGDLPPNDYQLALRSISYANSSDAPVTTQRDITVVVTDTQNHVGDTGHSYINLTAVNDAPLLGAAAASFTAINEDASASAGNTVAQLMADGRITDPDLSSSVPEAIAVSAVDNTHGSWQYKLSSGDWTAFDFSANSGKALLLGSADTIRFVPTADWNGTAANGITFYAWDKTSSAVAGDYLTVSGNTGSDKVLSTATGTAAITVNAVNDAPVMSGSGSNMTGITEDAINNPGQAVSALLATVTDIDSATQGIAIYGTTVTGPTTGGTWQYNVSSGGWVDFGTVTEASALLLKSTDLVRFVPDAKNGQTVSFDYHAWDQYSGAAGSKVDVSVRGDITAFSSASDSVSITVTDVNDAPVLDLDTGTPGNNYVTSFLVRSGVGVAIASPTAISITDVDVTAANIPESVSGATVAITGGAVDNNFGTTYEKLTSGSGASVTSSLGNIITISGSGTTGITISGAGTPTEYQNIIKAITYENANPNARTGARTVTVTLADGALTGGSAATATATTTINNIWAPVVDTNGVQAGVKYTTSYTQGQLGGVKVATADATITDEDSYLKSVVISIHDAAGAVVSNGSETLSITIGDGANWNNLGITVSGSGTNTITLTGDKPPSIYQLALRSISYANISTSPGEVTRTINVVGTDIDNHVGYAGYTDINVIPVNSPPTLAAVMTGSIAEISLTSTTTDSGLTGTLVGSDVETASGSLLYGISGGTAGTGADAGTVLKVGTYGTLKVHTAGGAYEYVQNSAAVEALAKDASAHDDFTVTVSDGGLTNTSPPTSGPTRTFIVNLTGANDTPIASGTYSHTITDTAALNVFSTLTGTLAATDVDTADTLTWSGSATGSYGALTVNADGSYSYVVDAAVVNALQTGHDATENFTVTVTDSQGATATRTITMNVVSANDTPIASGTYSHTITDTVALNTYSNLTGTLAATDVDSADTLTWSGSATGSYGALTVNADGSYSYVVNAAAVNDLQTGHDATDNFTVTVTDSQGATATRTITMNVVSANDTPVASGIYSHTITDTAALNTYSNLTGTLAATDVDSADTLTWSGSATGSYGALTISANGGYSYVVNAAAVNALQTGHDATENFTVTVTDSQGATATRTITMNVVSANDTPIASGTYSHTITDTAALNTYSNLTGTLAATDVDSADTLTWSGSATGSYGALTISANGGYSYVVNAAAVNALQTGHDATENFTVTVTDSQGATATRTITMNVVSANDTPIASGTYSHTITDTAALNTYSNLTGTLAATDVDTADSLIWSGSATGSYGALTVSANGGYSYVVNAVAVNALQTGHDATDNFTVTVTDSQGATATRTITMNVVSANDTPIASGTYSHTITDTAALNTYSNLTGTLAATDVDSADTLIWSGSATGSYGALTVSANGGYSYVVNAAAVNALQTGHNATENFTVTVTDSQGATATRTITMNVVSANDTPIASGTYSHTITDTAALNTYSNLTGTLAATDVDTADTLTWSGSATGSYGALTVSANGSYNYVVNAAAVNALQTGHDATENFTVTVTDSQGATATRTITMNVVSANDTPIASGTYSHTITDTAALNTYSNLTGTLAATDVDSADTLTWSGSATGSYGALTISANGGYSYVVNAAAVNALQTGHDATENFTVTVTDSQGATATRTITMNVVSANDTPIASGTYSHTITDTAALNTYSNLTGTLTATDVDTADTLTWSGSATGSYGALTVNTNGSYSYVVYAAAVNALQIGSSTVENFTVTVTDSKGATDIRTIAINVIAANDTPIVTNASSALVGAVTEAGHLDNGQAVLNGMGVDGLTHVTGTLSASDVDTGATQTWSIADASPNTTYGTMSINAGTGAWNFALNNYLPATQALKEGDVVTQTYIARVTDDFGAYVDQTVTITITGTNDVPVVANEASAQVGSITESGYQVVGTAAVSGTLRASDVDAGATQAWSMVGTPSTTYGTIAINSATGVWTYSLDNTLDATQALKAGEIVTQTYTARVTDDKNAFVNQTITVTITGSDDRTVVSGSSTAAVDETNAAVVATGTLIATDPDSSNAFVVQTAAPGSNGYGTFSITAGGVWSYTANTAHNEFVAGTSYTDSITVATADGTTQAVTVTIAGTNDAAVIIGTSTASLTETNAALTAGGTLAASDVDSAATFVAQTNVAGDHAFGKFSITTAGVWTYIADSAHNEFAAGTTYTDSITVATVDGTQQIVTITIAGTNDAAVITGTSTASLTETNAVLTATGTLTSTDVDGTANLFTAQTNVAGDHAFGKFSITTAGVWTYTSDSAHNEFAAGTTYSDSITVATADGTTKTVTVTIAGTNDAAVITGSSTASLTETNAVLTATGTLAASDVDSATTFVAQTNVAGNHAFGTFSITTAGVWSYTANNAHNEFAAGTNYTDSITVATADGTTQVVTVTIAGTNDTAVITGTSTASLSETNAALTASGTLISTDVDGTANLFTAQTNVAGDHAFGKFSVTTAGVWTYTADSAHNEFAAGTNYTDSITVATGDGTTQTVTVTIAGTNDTAVITGNSTVSLSETNAALTTVGIISASDVDSSAAFVAQTNVAGNNGYGIFSINAAGGFSYAANSAHNEFVAGTTYSDSITVATADGTTQVVTVTIAGTNDAAVISGVSTANLTETNSVLTATGTLICADVDGTANVFTAQTNVAGDHAFGKFSITAAGAWSYTADNAHNEFAAGTNYTDSITVAAADGTTQVVTVTIAGTNDTPTISGVPDAVTAVTVGQAEALPDFSVADAESGILNVTLTAVNGTINGLVDSGASTAGIQLVGTAADINAAIAAATFTALAVADASIAMVVTDAGHATASATHHMTADNAGVLPAVEAQVPSLPPSGGGTAVAGDGNGDGIPDNQQLAVTSVPFVSTSTPISNPGSAVTAPTYVTLVTNSNAGVVDTTHAGSSLLTNMQQLDAPGGLPTAMHMPLGELTFTAVTDTVGVSETFSLFVDSSVGANGYWSQNSSGTWVNLATHIETVGDKTRIDFTVTDGGAYDADHTADGTITDNGAVGSMPLSIVGTVPVTTQGGFFF